MDRDDYKINFMREISNKLNEYFKKYYQNFEKKYDDKAINFLTENRIDVVAKIIYCEYFLNITPSSFNRLFYYLHLKKWNNFKVKDSNKKNFSDFEKSFQKIILSIKKKGFDKNKTIIPIDEKNNIIDGSHRVAASIVLDKKITISKFKVKSPQINIASFANRFNFIKNETLMNYLIFNYIKYSPNLRILILFPVRNKKYDSSCFQLLNKYGNIELKKNINVGSLINAFNMCRVFYDGCEWIGNADNNYKGAAWKSKACFGNTNGVAEVLLFNPKIEESGSVSYLKKIKEEIRSFYQIRFHSIHSADDHNETIRYSKIFFHTKTQILLSKRKVNFFFKLEKLLEELKKININSSQFVFSGSAVMAALGLREPKDFDAFHSTCFILPKNISSHNSQNKYLNENINELIFNPKKYFYYMGFKFLDPKIILNLKINRNNVKENLKDKNDIKILKNFLFQNN